MRAQAGKIASVRLLPSRSGRRSTPLAPLNPPRPEFDYGVETRVGRWEPMIQELEHEPINNNGPMTSGLRQFGGVHRATTFEVRVLDFSIRNQTCTMVPCFADAAWIQS